MNVVTSLPDLDSTQSSAVSIGNFDGLHLGHRTILNRVVARARELGLRAAVMTFSPHPVRFLSPARAPKLISTLDQKVRLIEETGVDLLFIVNFDAEFARLSPEEFVHRYLIGGLKARSVCVGNNFNFGYQQRGRIETLRQFRNHFEIIEVPPIQVRGVVVSSSRVRQLVASGSVSRACRLLGRWFSVEGVIIPGSGRGKSLTVPTLNLKTDNELLPETGVYITRISLDGHEFLDSITNVGVRPTFGETTLVIETFVLNDTVAPGAMTARVEFLRRIRNEVKFDSPEALRRQIALDTGRAQRFFALMREYRHAGNG